MDRTTVTCIFKAVLGPFSWRASLFGTLNSRNIQGRPGTCWLPPGEPGARESCSYLRVLPAGIQGYFFLKDMTNGDQCTMFFIFLHDLL